MPETHRFLIMTTDPVHIGTGGMRLGRVDNTIVREPGTNLPKIPGTALHGAIRAYAARRYGKPQCAGQGGREGRKHCGRPTCPICYTFGSVQGEAGSFSGVVSISDARILLFPVYSMVGPVWVTSPGVLEDAGLGNNFTVSPDKAKWDGNGELPTDKPINLGWLMVEREDNFPSIQWPDEIPAQIRNRVVLVSDKLFSQIVNSNLEVRTSVAINPETGAAEEHALFTYEAIPRTTVLWFDVVLDDFRNAFPSKERLERFFNFSPDDKPDRNDLKSKGWDEENGDQRRDLTHYKENNLNWNRPVDIINSGLEWVEHLGIGGMGTRGFGRVRKIHCWDVKTDKNCGSDELSHGDTGNTEKSSL